MNKRYKLNLCNVDLGYMLVSNQVRLCLQEPCCKKIEDYAYNDHVARKDKRLCLYTENLEDLRIYLVSVAIRILVKTELRARRHGALG